MAVTPAAAAGSPVVRLGAGTGRRAGRIVLLQPVLPEPEPAGHEAFRQQHLAGLGGGAGAGKGAGGGAGKAVPAGVRCREQAGVGAVAGRRDALDGLRASACLLDGDDGDGEDSWHDPAS